MNSSRFPVVLTCQWPTGIWSLGLLKFFIGMFGAMWSEAREIQKLGVRDLGGVCV